MDTEKTHIYNSPIEKIFFVSLCGMVVFSCLLFPLMTSVVFAMVILIFTILWHELCHAVVARSLGLTVNFLAIFIPMGFSIPLPTFLVRWLKLGQNSTNHHQTSLNKQFLNGMISLVKFDGTLIEFEVWQIKKLVLGSLPIGGGIDIPDDQFWLTHPVKRILVALAGPIGNFILAYLSLRLMLDHNTAVFVLEEIFKAIFTSFQMLFGGQVPLSQVGGPIEIVDVTAQAIRADWFQGAILFTTIINLSLGITNLLPLFVTDGGQVVTALIHAAFGDGIRTWVKPINRIFTYLLFGLTIGLLLLDVVKRLV